MEPLTFETPEAAIQYMMEEMGALQLAFAILVQGMAKLEIIELAGFRDALDHFCQTTAPRASEAVERLKIMLAEPQVGLTVIDGGKQ